VSGTGTVTPVSDEVEGHPLYLRRFAAVVEGRPLG